MNLKDQMNQGAKEYGAEGGGQFQFSKSGKYSLRILCQPIAIATHFFGQGNPSHVCVGKEKGCPFHTSDHKKPSVKFITYVIDRQDEDKVKIAELPWAVISEVADFQVEPEYAFEEYPIPYDILVTVDKAASPADIYKTMAARSNSEVPAEKIAELEERMKEKTPEKYVEQRKSKQVEKMELEKQYDGDAQQQEAPDYPEGPEGEPTI